MEPETLPKTAAEVRVYEFDFSAQPEIRVGEQTITSVESITVTPSGELTLGSASISGALVQVQISGGVAGTRYLLKVLVHLSGGGKIEMGAVLSIIAFAKPDV